MLREFTDAAGKPWRVWDVYPSVRGRVPGSSDETPLSVAFPNRELSDGWLCFASGSEKRRLAPIPPEWEICAIPQLVALCEQAGYISRSGPLDAIT